MVTESAERQVVLLLALVPYLIKNGPTEVTVIAKDFGVSEKLIRKLAMFLATTGHPGETGKYLDGDIFDIDWEAFEEEDILRLTKHVVIDQAPKLSGSEAATIIAGLQLIEASVPDNLRPALDSLEGKLAEISTNIKKSVTLSSDDGGGGNLKTIREALKKKLRVKFDYLAKDGSLTPRSVDPLRLSQLDEYWYLEGFCLLRQANRVFRLEAVSNLKMTSEPIARYSEVTKKKPFEVSGNITATVRVPASLQHLLDAWNPQVVDLSEPGFVCFQIELVHEQQAVRLVALAPGHIEIIAPKHLRDFVSASAEHALQAF